jgi:hypothetical protein
MVLGIVQLAGRGTYQKLLASGNRNREDQARVHQVMVNGNLVYVPLLYLIFNLAIIATFWPTPKPFPFIKNHGRFHRQLVAEITSRRTSMQVLEGLEECQYDGQCPMKKTCAATPQKSNLGGMCLPYDEGEAPPANRKPIAGSWFDECVDRCVRGWELQQQHYRGVVTTILQETQRVEKLPGRPLGCNILFSVDSNTSTDQEKELPASKLSSTSGISPIVRIDPYSPNHGLLTTHNNEDEDGLPSSFLWNAFCYAPCDDSDTTECAVGFVCESGTCQRYTDYWQEEPDVNPPGMVIVTAANQVYWKGLLNLAASLRYWAPRHKLVVYNLGDLSNQQQKEVESWSNVLSVEWKEGIPSKYPSHVHQLKKYAWKPIIVNETLHQYPSIFWLDAGSTITAPLTPIEQIVQREGIFLVQGQDADMSMSHPGTYAWFSFLDKNKTTFVGGPHYAGNTIAVSNPSRYVDMVDEWAKCALDEACIAPLGSSLQNHRYDQTSLSILSYTRHIPHYTEYLAAERHQLARNLKNNSSSSNGKIIWTSRQSNSFYWLDEHQKTRKPRKVE